MLGLLQLSLANPSLEQLEECPGNNSDGEGLEEVNEQSQLHGRKRRRHLRWLSGWETDSLPSPGNRGKEMEVDGVAEHPLAEWTDQDDDGPGPGQRHRSRRLGSTGQHDCDGPKDPMPASPPKVVSTPNRRRLAAGQGVIARAAQVRRALDLQ